MDPLKRWLWYSGGGLLLGLLAVGSVRWVEAWIDLNQPSRRAAWEQLRREGNPDFVIWERVPRADRDVMVPRFNPNAAMLWLAMGHDPGGNACLKKGNEPPTAFQIAIMRPLGICEPRDSGQMPFVHVVLHGFSPEAREVAQMMIAAGADVNKTSPDGIVPLENAVFKENEEMVHLLLQAGADPLLKPKHNQIGNFRSALETAEGLPRSPRADRIRAMVRKAAERAPLPKQQSGPKSISR